MDVHKHTEAGPLLEAGLFPALADGASTSRDGLEDRLAKLNPAQREAVSHTEGPLLIIAGAGSGKTSVLCHRVANIINRGLALPWQILAVTFTNKAAGELRERLSLLDVPNAGDIWAGTFHSTCVKILRRGIEDVGYKKGFTVYDTDDSLRVIKACLKELNISEKAFAPKSLLQAISKAKDKLIKPQNFNPQADGTRDFLLETVKDVYRLYQKKLKAANALDFDDLIFKSVELLESRPDVLEKWQKQFRYIIVDEYQDTNHAQYRLISLIAGKNGNLCVVGDEDQSIYRFRGATIENILSFEGGFKARVIKLEQNYRSTQNILGAANGIISKNTQRKGKRLFTQTKGGDRVALHILEDEQEEAVFISREIEHGKGQGIRFGDNAVLYRANAQSRTVELALARQSIPYRIIGGVRFYERMEIRDMLAYMSVIENPFDLVRFRRIINQPRRGIGDTTQAEIERISVDLGISPIDVMANAGEYAALQRKARLLEKTAEIFKELTASAEQGRYLPDLIDDITEQSGYTRMLRDEGDEGVSRIENIKELKSALVKFCEENEDYTLADYLEQAALVADTDDYISGEDRVVLMTVHAAKGLEFNRVFLIGAEETVFPSFRSIADPMDLEEERRLAYVAVTRAKRALIITAAKQRLLYGATQRNPVSRFVKEIPPEYITVNESRNKKTASVSATPKKSRPSYLREQAKTAHARVNQKDADAKTAATSFSEGERVKHKVFGDGTVLDINPMGGDFLLEIAFDKVGTKKVMANFAKIEKM